MLETSLHVESLADASQFYQRALGLAILIEDERMVALALPGGAALLLFQRGASLAPGDMPDGMSLPRDGGGTQHLCLAVPTGSLDDWERHLMVNGIVIESRVVQAHGGTSLYFRDLDGHAVEVASPGVATAEQSHGTLPGLLAAIARAESGRPVPPLPGLQPWPWAVNADGAAMYFESKAAAVAWTSLTLARGAHQVDVGCMQINLQSHPSAFSSLDQAFEPLANAEYGARFLSTLHADAGGNWYVATGYYHSRTPVLAADYRERVAAIAEGRIPPASLGIPLYQRAIQQGSLRIQLPGGGIMRINTARQPAPRRRRLTACQVAAVLGPFMAANARASCAGRAAPRLQAGLQTRP